MRYRTMTAVALAAALAGAPVGTALAQQNPMLNPQNWNWHIGGGLGYFQLEEDTLDVDEIDDEDIAFKVFTGANFGRWLGAEAGYVNFGEVGDASSIEADGWTLAATVGFPMAIATPYAKIGRFWWDADRADPIAGTVSDDGNDMFWGAGLGFAVSERFDLTVEYERYEIEQADIDSGWVNVRWNF